MCGMLPFSNGLSATLYIEIKIAADSCQLQRSHMGCSPFNAWCLMANVVLMGVTPCFMDGNVVISL